MNNMGYRKQRDAKVLCMVLGTKNTGLLECVQTYEINLNSW